MRASGVRFLRTPQTYYDELKDRLDWSTIDADIDELAELGILADQSNRRAQGEPVQRARSERPPRSRR